MANIAVHRDGPSTAIARAPKSRWDPLRAIRGLVASDPFRQMSMPNIPLPPAAFAPAFEVKETKDSYVFTADVPGVKESDLSVTLTNNRLTVGGKRDEERREQTDTLYSYERSYGDFMRSFTLPEGVDASNVQAELKEGVLRVVVRKKAGVMPKKIAIKSSGSKS